MQGGYMKTIAFFGHRQIFNKQLVEERLIKVIEEVIPQGFSKFLIGSHGEFDSIALSTCLRYKRRNNGNITINVVLTSLSALSRKKYGYSKADIYKNKGCEPILYDIEDEYIKNRIIASNKKMVDESDLIICYVDRNLHKSGAKSAILYALKQNKRVINLFKESDMMK